MRFKKLAALASAVVMLTSVSLTPAYAANTIDTDWSFFIKPNDSTYTTPLREKSDDSGVYVYYKDGDYSWLECDVLNSEGKSMCYGRPGSIKKGQRGRIAQMVYEDGYRFCKLKLKANNYAPIYGNASGVWSPDCAGTYPYVNTIV